MAGMFANPFVFDRSQILGEGYSPEALYPGMFGQGGQMAQGGMFGPPTQNVSRETGGMDWQAILEALQQQQSQGPGTGLAPMDGATPPGLMPWSPLPPTDPNEVPPPVVEEPPVAQAAAEMPANVQAYLSAMRRSTKDSPGFPRQHVDAINWLQENQGTLSVPDQLQLAGQARKSRAARELYNMK